METGCQTSSVCSCVCVEGFNFMWTLKVSTNLIHELLDLVFSSFHVHSPGQEMQTVFVTVQEKHPYFELSQLLWTTWNLEENKIKQINLKYELPPSSWDK